MDGETKRDLAGLNGKKMLLPLAAGQHMLESAAATAKEMEAFARRFERDLEKADTDIERAFANIPDPDGEKMEAAKIETRLEIFKKVDSDLKFRELVRNAVGMRERAERAAEYYRDSAKLGEILTLGSEKRATYSANLRGAGHAGLRTAVETAVANRDLDLAMAAGSEILRLKSRDRPVDVGEMIRACLPDSAKAKQRMFRDALERLDEFDLAKMRIRSTKNPGHGSSFKKIQVGLRRREAQ